MSALESEIYEFGEFRVDATARDLRVRGEVVPLTPRVFDTLYYFVRNAGRVLEKDELMKAIWPDAFVEENNLTQNVSALRRALGASRGQSSLIITVPGHGYRFAAEVSVHTAGGEASAAPVDRLVRTLAVLPFKPLVEAGRNEALELGMADTLIARLSRIREVIVRPLSSVRRYGGLEQDPQVAGRELGVESVLDGSIQRWGERIRVTVRLIDVRDGVSLWVDTLDEMFTDVFALQDAISERVAGALALRLSSEERTALTRRYTESTEAYELYLKGRYHWSKLIPPEIHRSIEFFRQSIAVDPANALAYAGLLEAYRSLPITSDARPKDVFPLASTAASMALAIDESLVEVHASLAFIKLWYDWDDDGALREATRAIALNPNSSEAHRSYAHVLWGLGRFAEAVAEGARARELDPLSLLTSAQEGMYLQSAGRIDDARDRLTRTLEIEPEFWIALLWLGKLDIRQGRYDDAIENLTRARNASHGNSETISLTAYAWAMAGKRSKALEVLAELETLSTQRYVPAYAMATVHNGLGDDERVFLALEKALDERDVRLYWLRIEPMWDRLRSHPRFAAILERMRPD